jgi:ABC-type sulfate transport system permease component
MMRIPKVRQGITIALSMLILLGIVLITMVFSNWVSDQGGKGWAEITVSADGRLVAAATSNRIIRE